eukprot:357426-Prymnesium_polylepis.2
MVPVAGRKGRKDLPSFVVAGAWHSCMNTERHWLTAWSIRAVPLRIDHGVVLLRNARHHG